MQARLRLRCATGLACVWGIPVISQMLSSALWNREYAQSIFHFNPRTLKFDLRVNSKALIRKRVSL